MKNVQNWPRANKLTLNMTKTAEFMLTGSRQRLSTVTVSPTLAINDFRVTQVATAKSLGVTIDDNLDWGSHMEKIIKKVSSGIGAIKRVLKAPCPQATLQLIYQALIHPHFNYCNTVWGNCGITLRNKLQKLQNRAARVLTFSDYDEDAGYLFELLGWNNLARQHELKKPRSFISLVLGLQYEKRHMTLETLRINFASPYHGQIITKIALELVAPSYGTNSRVM